MAGNDDKDNKKPRLTEEKIAEIKRLHRQGVSQTEIATRVNCHRQTVRLHLQEKTADTVAEGARRDVLADALRRHFQQLSDFAGSNLRTRLDASLDVYPRRKHRKSREAGPIIVSGMMALPYELGSTHMCEEWMRMYLLSAKDTQLLKSLRDHTKESPFWTYWDQWRKKVADYESSAMELLEWVDQKMEKRIPGITSVRIGIARVWLFGNILRAAAGTKCEDIQVFRIIVLGEGGVIMGHEPGVDRDGSEALYTKLYSLIEEAKAEVPWAKLKSVTTELSDNNTQTELRHLAKKLDDALAGIELMQAFPGHCDLCPV